MNEVGCSLQPSLGLRAGSPLWGGGRVGFRLADGVGEVGGQQGRMGAGQGWGVMSSGCPGD